MGHSPRLAEADPVGRSRQARTKILNTLVEIPEEAASDAGSTPAASTKPNVVIEYAGVSFVRVLVGVVIGLGLGLIITVVVIAAKVGFLVNTPRSTHPFVLAALFAVPALAGGLIGALWRRPSGPK